MFDPQLPLDTPLRFVIHDLDDSDVCLCCPDCGNEHVHPARVAVEQGRTRTEVSRESTVVGPSSRAGVWRGSLIALRFWCEGGHAFEYRYSFLKGQLLCELLTWKIDVSQQQEELWRD